ncbi:hypothetical protein [Planctomycetes bacterium CA13]|uniref:hypothetical protein n=1 Tax=Novipirellula herctigrandis TaxID=2527986 RepID=UPI0011B38BB9
MLWTLAIHHLLYLIEFGVDTNDDGRWHNGRYRPSHSDAFEKWIAKDAPGLERDDLVRCLRDNPLDV